MKKSALVLLLGILLLVAGCSKKSTTPEQKPTEDYTLQTSQTIGSDGGTIEVDDFSLTVPAGAFGTDANLKLYASSKDKPFGDNCVTRAFRLEGLPDEFSQPLHLRIKYQDTLSYKSFIAVGEEAVGSISGLTIGYDLLTAIDSSGYLICEVPVREAVGQTHGGTHSQTGRVEKAYSPGFGPIFVGTTSHGEHETANFKIDYIKDEVFSSQAENLGKYLEAAYDTLEKLGFVYAARKTWPVEVHIRDLRSDKVWGEFVYNARKAKEKNFLRFNSTKMIDDKNIKVTAGHEFFHLVQNLYDPRTNEQIDADNKYEWLDEATAVWSEEKYSSDPGNYVSGVFGENHMEPFYGVQVCPESEGGQTGNPDVHGYGMAAVIKHLTQQDGDSLVLKIYNKVKQLEHPALALIRSAKSQPEVWWPAFFRKYISGNIYNQKPVDLWSNIRNLWTIEKDSDTLWTRPSQKYHDLSAKLYRINLKHPSISPDARLKCTVAGADLRPGIMVFKYNAGNFIYLDYHADSVTIPGLKALKDEGSHVLIVPINNKYHDPYSTALRDGQMTVRVFSETAYDCNFLLDFSGTYKVTFPDKPDETHPANFRIAASDLPGRLVYDTDTTFEADWERENPGSPGYKDKGTLFIKLTNKLSTATQLNFSQTVEWSDYTQDYVVTAINVPGQINLPPDNWLLYNVKGTQTCNHLTEIQWSESFKNGITSTFVQGSLTCYDFSELSVYISK